MQASNNANFITSYTKTRCQTVMALAVLAIATSGFSLSGRSASNASDENDIPLTGQPYTLNSTLLASSEIKLDSQSRPAPARVRVFDMLPQTDMLSKGDPLWQDIAVTGDLALHIAGSFNDLQMQLWVVRK